jgi:hypothetical protein
MTVTSLVRVSVTEYGLFRCTNPLSEPKGMSVPHLDVIRVTVLSLDRSCGKNAPARCRHFHRITLICQVGEVSVKINYAIFCILELSML